MVLNQSFSNVKQRIAEQNRNTEKTTCKHEFSLTIRLLLSADSIHDSTESYGLCTSIEL